MVFGNGARRGLVAACVLLLILTSACAPKNGPRRAGTVTVQSDPCQALGNWVAPGGGLLEARSLITDMADRSVVLLGESHNNPEDHRWQLQSLVALHTLNPDLVVGFEMFPRSKQSVLDDWVAGELDEEAFLDAVEWQRVWGYDPSLYMPLLRFVRMNRVPAVALNVERSLVARVGRDGWESIPKEQREGLSDPAPPPRPYRDALFQVYAYQHSASTESSDGDAGGSGFEKFVAAQLTWDRAMAEALFKARGRHDVDLAVGIMGRGHVEGGHGVAHQLADQGIENTGLLLTTPIGTDCADLEEGIADALFTVADWQPSAKRRLVLGVQLTNGDNGAFVAEVTPGSVAETAGIATGDLIVSAAGRTVGARGDLIATIRRQAPGTWLPLTVLREGRHIELVAKFPIHGAGA